MSQPTIVEPSQIHSGTQQDNETTAPSERCGYCGNHKRPENKDGLTATPVGKICECPNACDSKDPNIRLGAVPASAFRRSASPRPSLVPPLESGESETVTSADLISGLTSKFEIISVREKHGDFRKAIPHMPLPLAILLCIFNVILPGTGTLLSSVAAACGCPCEQERRGRAVGYNLLAALLQLLMAPIIVGWIWSVLWGITFVNISVAKEVDEPNASTMI